MKRAKRLSRRRLAAPVGGVFLALAVIGLAAVALFVSDSIRGLFDNSAERARYESFVRPLVMMDPVPFSRVENLEQNLILPASLWSALMNQASADYAYDENGLLLVPSSDVDVAAARLFGPNVIIIHQSFDDPDASYLFDPEISAYRVPTIAKVAYSPSVEDIDHNGDQITLRVGYLSPGSFWITNPQQGADAKPAPEKYMLYDLTRWEDGYYISAVRDVLENQPPVS